MCGRAVMAGGSAVEASEAMKLIVEKRRVGCMYGLYLPANHLSRYIEKTLYAQTRPHVRLQCNTGAHLRAQRQCLPVMGWRLG